MLVIYLPRYPCVLQWGICIVGAGVQAFGILETQLSQELSYRCANCLIWCAGCGCLMRVVISSASLLSLNISGNSALCHLDVRCAALTSLTASQCHRLEQLQEDFACPSLKAVNFAGCSSLQGVSRSTLSSGFWLPAQAQESYRNAKGRLYADSPLGVLLMPISALCEGSAMNLR